jgi:phosphinothricin acetyltransferase
MGLRTILAGISSLNPKSLAFHERQGFVQCGRFLNVGRKWGKDFDVVWMQKTI